MRGLATASWLLAWALAQPAGAASSLPGPPDANPLGGHLPPVAESTLAATRGGFQMPGGLLASFGVVRSVAVDGVLVSTTVVGDAAAPGGAAAPSGGVLTVVQNAQDGRRIQVTTQIDATVRGLASLRQSALQSTLRGAVIDSLRR